MCLNSFLKKAGLLIAASVITPLAFAQQDAEGGNTSSKEEGNRNVMLNAASANGPREIQIGLPSADVNVLENGIPITYATNPHGINSMWRTDASLAHVGLQKISETAITTGRAFRRWLFTALVTGVSAMLWLSFARVLPVAGAITSTSSSFLGPIGSTEGISQSTSCPVNSSSRSSRSSEVPNLVSVKAAFSDAMGITVS